MMIIVPYVNGMLRRHTAETPDAEFVNLTGDPFAYWRLLRHLYESGYDFLIIEQDITLTAAQIDTLDACPEPWCVFAYNRGGQPLEALGAFRLRKEVYAAYTFLLTRDVPKEIPFDQCDGWIYSRLFAAGYKPHTHDGLAAHDPSALRVVGSVFPVMSNERYLQWAEEHPLDA